MPGGVVWGILDIVRGGGIRLGLSSWDTGTAGVAGVGWGDVLDPSGSGGVLYGVCGGDSGVISPSGTPKTLVSSWFGMFIYLSRVIVTYTLIIGGVKVGI